MDATEREALSISSVALDSRRLRRGRRSRRFRRLALTAVLLLAGAASAGVKFTIPIAVFSYDYQPAEPREAYLAGDLGILMPTYARSYLYVAHRWMDGSPITLEEQDQIKETWFTIPEAPENQRSVWQDLRASIDVPPPPIYPANRTRSLNTRGYVQFQPCLPHTYQRAADRLREHVDRFGAGSSEVREWVQAQDIVLHHCELPRDGLNPADAPSSVHPIIREDRRYQIAAAQFISTQFEEAERSFAEIEPKAESWAGLWAPYMVGRSILWQARTYLGDEVTYRQKLRGAQVALEAVLRNDELAQTHNAARFLLIRILAITDPEAAARLLGLRLSSPLRAESRVQDLEQYRSLLYHNTRDIEEYRYVMKPHAELRKLGERDALTDWILAFQSQDADAFQHSLSRWRETRSTAWLVACLHKATADSEETPELLSAADDLPPRPGWASVQYYRAKLLVARGEREEARVVLDRLLPEIAQRSSSWNRALALRAELGRTPEELLHYGIRYPASFGVPNEL